MLPVIALVGRPNVGKSTLFNVLTGTRDALVADQPGLTRDRKYGFGKVGPLPYIVVDTGGLIEYPGGLEAQMAEQSLRAVGESDRVVLVVDAKEGLTAADEYVAKSLRRGGKTVTLAVNKCESRDPVLMAAEFHALALGEPICISAAHEQGVGALMEQVLDGLAPGETPAPVDEGIRVAVIGRPNVGKSTLINRLLGEERVIASA